jgi:uncharacterized protein (DUF362 family)
MERTNRSKVFVADASDRFRGVKRLLDEFDIAAEGTVALKANYNSDDPFPATTHPETLRALIEGIKGAASGDMVMAERSGMGRTRSVLRNRGVLDLSRKLGFRLADLDAMVLEGWREIPSEGLHWRNGFLIARIFLEADKVVQTCCLKTHRFGGHFTMSLKNSVGLVAARPPGIQHDYMRELHASPFQRLMIAEINKFYRTDLVLMDAAQGFVKGGPESGELIEPRVLLAGKDRVAIDAVGVALLRHYGTTPEVMRGGIFDLEQIARAGSLGVGVTSKDQIDLVPLDDQGQKACHIIKNILDSQG